MSAYFNPYEDCSFLQFFYVFFSRLNAFMDSQQTIALATDELQLFVLWSVGISSTLIGSFLVLRKMTMLANALSHTVLFGIIVSFIAWKSFQIDSFETTLPFPYLFFGAMFSGLLTTFFTQFLVTKAGVKEDASIGIVFSFLFSFAVVLTSLFAKTSHVGIEMIMGNIDALTSKDLSLSFEVLLFNIFLIALFFRQYHVLSFDKGFSHSLGLKSYVWNYLLMFQVSMTCISAFRVMGVVMILTLMVAPILIAKTCSRSVLQLIVISGVSSLILSMISIALSRHILSFYQLPLSTSGLTVLVFFLATVLVYFISFFIKKKL